MQTSRSEEEFLQRQGELKAAAALWETSHNALQYGNHDLQLDDVNNSEKTLLLFLELEPLYMGILGAIKGILEVDYADDLRGPLMIEYNDQILSYEADYLKLMSAVTFDYDNESSQRLETLSKTEYLLLFMALSLLVLEAWFIFKPAIGKIKRSTNELVYKEIFLSQSLDEIRQKKAEVDYLNQQAETVFQNVNQGIFLLDPNYNISTMRSKALNQILMEEDIEGKNFVQILRPRLVQRDIDALEMFIKHLYNPEIETEVLNQLNPIAEVKLFSDSNSELDHRHLRVSFSRISDQSGIKNILVNISDETSAIRLKQQIKASEEKNQRESEQLLSILKIDPKMLKDFLENTYDTLLKISEEYEHYKERDFSKLAIYTYQVIHNLKGNAQFIDLKLLTDRFHALEDIVHSLKSQNTITGHDFLKILFEVNEINHIIRNMKQMLLKIANVNQVMSDKVIHVVPDQRFVSSLRKGLKKMCDECDKTVMLKYIDNGIKIPSHYQVSLKDMIIQLMRNSLAHGIETHQERIGHGKEERATITIEFLMADDNQLTLKYRDDGKGLDMGEIIYKAWEMKLLSKTEIEEIDQKKAIELIFNNGLSTSNVVNQYAGRGQGLSLVKSIIEKHSGHYTVASKKGYGFRININLPVAVEHKLEEVLV